MASFPERRIEATRTFGAEYADAPEPIKAVIDGLVRVVARARVQLRGDAERPGRLEADDDFWEPLLIQECQ